MDTEDLAKDFKNSEIELEEVKVEKERDDDSRKLSAKSTFSTFEINKDRPTLEVIMKDVGLTVRPAQGCKKGPPKRILQTINARFSPGKLIFIMGSSGSGKTTLLNILGQKIGGEAHGEVLANGKKIGKEFKKSSSYVMQDDLLIPTLSVYETLLYAARLRLAKHLNLEERIKIVEQVIKVLNLGSCRDTKIGGEGQKGISGGQRKRVSIGQELLVDPSVIFLDEPTSGLDSATSINLIRSMKDFARQGRTIVATIHQPSAEIFFLCDKLLLLANGFQVYFGSPKDVVPYFANLGYQCPEYQNPADYVLNLITPGYELKKGNLMVESAEITKELIEAYPKQAKLKSPNDPSIDISIEQKEGVATEQPNEVTRFVVLLDRGFKATIRNPAATIAKAISSVFFAVLLGLVFLRLGTYQVDIQSREGILFFAVVNCFMPTLMETLYAFPSEKELFLREKGNNSYGTLAYYFAKILVLMPFQLVFSFLFGSVTYFMIGLQADAGKFFIFNFACVLVTYTATAMSLLISSLTPNFQLSLITAPMYFISTMILGGFFVIKSPIYLVWIKYVSPFLYGYQILAINEFSGLKLHCMTSELVNGTCPITNGEQVLSTIVDQSASLVRGFFLLIAIIGVAHILAILRLHILSKRQHA